MVHVVPFNARIVRIVLPVGAISVREPRILYSLRASLLYIAVHMHRGAKVREGCLRTQRHHSKGDVLVVNHSTGIVRTRVAAVVGFEVTREDSRVMLVGCAQYHLASTHPKDMRVGGSSETDCARIRVPNVRVNMAVTADIVCVCVRQPDEQSWVAA